MQNKRLRSAQGSKGQSADMISGTHLIIWWDPGAKAQSREPFVTETRSKLISKKQEIEQFNIRRHLTVV